MQSKQYLETVTPNDVHPVDHLRALLENVAPYPSGVVRIPAPVGGTSFFPGGMGIWNSPRSADLPPLPIGKVMVLGHDYHSETGYQRTLENEEENLKGPTWRHLLDLIELAKIQRTDCFFTNFFMGLRAGKSSTGRFPGNHDQEYVQMCLDFLIQQLRVQMPRLVLTLGKYVPALIAGLSDDLSPWKDAKSFKDIDQNDRCVLANVTFRQIPQVKPMTFVALVHPCYRARNVGIRRYKELRGEAAEIRMLADGMHQ